MIVDTKAKYNEAMDGLIGHQELVVDVETNGLEPYGANQICGVGVSPAYAETSYYFPVRHQQGQNLEWRYYKNLIDFLGHVPDVLIGYNLKFDLHFLLQDGLKSREQQFHDVLVMVRLIEPTAIKDLNLSATIKRHYGERAADYDIEMKKYLRTNKWHKDFSASPPGILGEYCKSDVDWTRKLYWDMKEKIEKSQQVDIWQLEIELTSILLDMERTGISIDTKYVTETIEKISYRQETVAKKIFNVAGDFNINSTQQLGVVLNERGIFSPDRTPKGAQSWGEASLVKINHPIAGNVRQYRTLGKLRSTYLEPYVDTEVLHTSFCNWGTITGRLSSREPNLHNIPRNHFNLADKVLNEVEQEEVRQKINAIMAAKGGVTDTALSSEVLDTWGFIGDESFNPSDDTQIAIRRMFTPRPDRYLVSFDYSQMEVRVFLSYLQNDDITAMLAQDNVDFHGEAAKLAFNVVESDDTFKFYRQMAKAITFGVIYGIGNKKLAIQLGTTPKQAGQYKRQYFAGLKGSKEFFDKVVQTVETRGWIKNRYGRVYHIPSDFAYKGVNYLVQGTSADIMNERLIAVSKALRMTSSKVLLQVHDEIICEIHKDDIRTVPFQIQQLLVQNSLDIPFQVDMELCDPSWASKTDLTVALSNGHFKQASLTDYIDWG